jgi:hypothetical protein
MSVWNRRRRVKLLGAAWWAGALLLCVTLGEVIPGESLPETLLVMAVAACAWPLWKLLGRVLGEWLWG